jgi:hypothetical protein
MHFLLYKNRKVTHTFTMLDAAGVLIVIAAGDVVRLKIGRDSGTPLLDLGSDSASASGSTVQAANPSDVAFAPGDTGLFTAGIYSVELLVVDESETGDPPKHAEKGVCTVIETMGGEVGV